MRLATLFISITFFVFIGCSTTYKVSKYYSKDQLYKDFNSSSKTRSWKLLQQTTVHFIPIARSK